MAAAEKITAEKAAGRAAAAKVEASSKPMRNRGERDAYS
jgi:hypothetical protein